MFINKEEEKNIVFFVAKNIIIYSKYQKKNKLKFLQLNLLFQQNKKQNLIFLLNYHQAHQPMKHWHKFSEDVACRINKST